MPLLLEIELAFPPLPIPNASRLFDGDDEGALEFFRDRRWCDLPTEVVDFHSVALQFFSPAGFAYYLPAFMAASIRNEDLGVVDVVVDALTPPKNDRARPSFAARWNSLTSAQQLSAIAFLRHFEDRDPIAISTAISVLAAPI